MARCTRVENRYCGRATVWLGADIPMELMAAATRLPGSIGEPNSEMVGRFAREIEATADFRTVGPLPRPVADQLVFTGTAKRGSNSASERGRAHMREALAGRPVASLFSTLTSGSAKYPAGSEFGQTVRLPSPSDQLRGLAPGRATESHQ